MQNNSSGKSPAGGSGMRKEWSPATLLWKADKTSVARSVWGTQEESGGSVLPLWDAR